MATSIASMLTGIKVDPNLAMTGEITLTGQVLADRRPQGESARRKARGHQEDSVAASRNEIDLDDIPKEVRDTMTFVPVDELSEVFEHALGKRLISPVPLGDGARMSNVVPMRRNGVVKRRARKAPLKR